MEKFAEYMDSDFLSVLRAFSEFDASSQDYARSKNVKAADLKVIEVKSRISNLRIELGSRNPSKPKERRRKTKALRKVFDKQRGFFEEVETFGSEGWDEIFNWCELCAFENIREQWVILQGEIGVREMSEAKTALRTAKGPIADDRPVFLAEKVAELFVALNLNIGVGKDDHNQQGPSGPYCKAVEYAFRQFDIDHNFFRPAERAAEFVRDKYGLK